jgi:hypothetical protein
MAYTLDKAYKKAEEFLEEFPNLDVIIVDNSKIFRNSSLNFNFRFQQKKENENKIRIAKEIKNLVS